MRLLACVIVFAALGCANAADSNVTSTDAPTVPPASALAEKPTVPPTVTPTVALTVKMPTVPRVAKNLTMCKCAGVRDARGHGGGTCKSRSNKNGLAWCFVNRGACADSKPFIPGVRAVKPGFDVSFDACGCANKGSGCKCAGVTDARDMGGKSCNASFGPRRPPFCYTKPGACCDGQASEDQASKNQTRFIMPYIL